MGKKVILLVRVSTKYQSYKEQKAELIEYVERDGYTTDEMEIIEDKESTKLSDEERQGLTKMYAAINNPNNQIEAVYCWELSRISRRPQSLYGVRDRLLRDKINLIAKHENFKLLNKEKELDKNSNIMLGFYISMCENEIHTKVERTKRVKTQKASEGLFTGGKYIKYGYKVNEKTKEYEIDEEKAQIIRECFELYSTGKYGLNTLYKEMIKKGYNVNIYQVQRIVTSPEYKGGIREGYTQIQKRKKQKKDRVINHYSRKYPQIIPIVLYNKCREIAKQNNTNIDKSKNIYYAHKLIKCTSCGAYLVAAKHTVQYQCPKKYSPLSKVVCNASDRINVNTIDSLLWFLTKEKESIFIIKQSKEEVIKYQTEIDNYQLKLDAIENRINVIKEKKKKDLRKQISENIMNDIELNLLIEKTIIEQKIEIENERITWESEINRLNKLINDIENQNKKYSDILYIKLDDAERKKQILKDLNSITDENIKYDLIHKHIKEVILSNKKKNYTKQIDVYYHLHERETYYYDFRNLNENERLYYLSTVNIENQKLPIPLKPIHSNDNIKKLDTSTIKDIEKDKLLNELFVSELDKEKKCFLPFEIEKRYLRKGEK